MKYHAHFRDFSPDDERKMQEAIKNMQPIAQVNLSDITPVSPDTIKAFMDHMLATGRATPVKMSGVLVPSTHVFKEICPLCKLEFTPHEELTPVLIHDGEFAGYVCDACAVQHADDNE